MILDGIDLQNVRLPYLFGGRDCFLDIINTLLLSGISFIIDRDSGDLKYFPQANQDPSLSLAITQSPMCESSEDTITACVMCKNAENTIQACISSIIPWADELVIVDSGSDDNTIDIIRAQNIYPDSHTWKSYSEQRNYMLSKVKTEWSIIIDQDEILPRYFGSTLRKVITLANHTDNNTVLFPRMWLCRLGDLSDTDGFCNVEYLQGSWTLWPDHQARLFRMSAKPYFEGRLYERLKMNDHGYHMISHLQDTTILHLRLLVTDILTRINIIKQRNRMDPFGPKPHMVQLLPEIHNYGIAGPVKIMLSEQCSKALEGILHHEISCEFSMTQVMDDKKHHPSYKLL